MTEVRKKIVCTKLLNNVQLQRLEKYFDVTHFDLIKAQPIQNKLTKETESHIILTSFKAAQIAIELLGKEASKKKYYCVGQKITELLHDLKLDLVHSELYSKDLAKWIVVNHSNLNFSYLCSNQRLEDLPLILLTEGVQFEEVFIYESRIADFVNYTKKLEEANCLMWFSPLGVKAMEHLHNNNKTRKHYCIGATTAKVVKEIPSMETSSVYHPTIPSVDGMIEMIIKKNI